MINGIQQWVRLALDRAAAAKTEEELKQALKRGTDPRAAEQNIGRIEKRMDSLVGFAKKGAAAMAGFFAIRKVGAFAAEMFQLGTAAEETGSKFATTFGTATKSSQEFLDSWARMAGLNKTVAQDVMATAGSIVQGMGMSQEASAKFSEQILRAAGDLQSFHNVPIQETFNALRAGLTGETEPLKRFGIVLSAASVEAMALVKSGKANKDALTEQEIAGARLTLMLEKMGPAMGDLDRTQLSTANRARMLQTDFENLRIDLALKLMPAFERLVSYLSENSEEISRFATELVGLVDKVGPHVGRFFEDLRREAVKFKKELEVIRDIMRGLGLIGHGVKGPGLEDRDIYGAEQHANVPIFRGEAAPRAGGTTTGTTGETPAQRRRREAEERKAAAAAKRTATAARRDQREEDERRTREMQAQDRRFNQGPKFENTIGTGRTPGISTRPMAMAIVASFEAEQAKIRETADVWREAHAHIENIAQRTAAGIMDSFGAAIEMMITGAGSIGDAFVGVGAGIARDILGGIKQMATGKVVEEIAWAASAFARGNIPAATAALIAAGKWTAAGGVAAGLGGAMGGIGGGAGAGVHRGGGVYGREAANNAQPAGETHIYLSGSFDIMNPEVQRVVYGANQLAQERYGPNSRVTVHRGGR